MNPDILDKLDRITDIWNNYIWNYKFISSKVEFNDDVRTNYLGDLLGYFRDTFEIVYSESRPSSFSGKFSYTISLLQAIYVQQDFIQEMLEIFKTGIDQRQLLKDITYSTNRTLRNELVGHPISKQKNGKLLSSTLFSNQVKNDEIKYLRYHKNNNYKFESISINIADIQKRHSDFLNKYFDLIINRLRVILDEYLVALSELENVIRGNDFNTTLKFVELYFESIFESDYVYDKSSLLKIYDRKEEHPRYKLFIDRFNKDLKNFLIDTKANIKMIFEHKRVENFNQGNSQLPKIDVVLASQTDEQREQKATYHYEIGKLATKRNKTDFKFFSSLLKSKCQNNRTVIEELKHMEIYMFDEIEYYTSLRLIGLELNEE